MSLLNKHLEQISQSASSIAELPFPQPKMFTNALLEPLDITSLIRDTEAHERALFSVDPNANARQSRRRGTTVFPDESSSSGVAARGPSTMASRIYAAQNSQHRHSAVAQVLGGDMIGQIKRSTAAAASGSGGSASGRHGVDIELLLRGAEMLCRVYPVPGAQQKIQELRAHYRQLSESLRLLERDVHRQNAELERMNQRSSSGAYDDEMDIDEPEVQDQQASEADATEAAIQAELEAIRSLEQRQRGLRQRVDGLDHKVGEMLG